LALGLNGRYSDHFRWLLRGCLEELQWLDGKVAELDGRISEAMQLHADLIRRLCTIPGVNQLTAWLLVAELGLNMDQFPDADHAASWAGLCPGNAESAGKRFSGKTRKGDRYLRRNLVQSAWAVAHKKDCFLTAVFYRTASRRGLKRAAVAVAHRILIIAYHLIRDGGEYREYGGDYFDRRQPECTAQRLIRRLERIGYAVVAKPPNSQVDVPVSEISHGPGRSCKCAERDISCTHRGARRVVSWSIPEGRNRNSLHPALPLRRLSVNNAMPGALPASTRVIRKNCTRIFQPCLQNQRLSANGFRRTVNRRHCSRDTDFKQFRPEFPGHKQPAASR
jgi:hypothetical protein